MMFGLSEKEIECAGAKWTAREVLQQPEVWAEVERLIAGEAHGLADFLDPLLARPGRVGPTVLLRDPGARQPPHCPRPFR